MSKKISVLHKSIAELGAKLATPKPSPQSDVVVGRTPPKGPQKRSLSVRLKKTELFRLDDFGLWLHQNGTRASEATILKAALRMLQKDEASLRMVRLVRDGDGRRARREPREGA